MPTRCTISQKQQDILEAIRVFSRDHGYPPSVREIGERVGLSSSSTVQSHLATLERRGLLKRNPTKPRGLTLVENEKVDASSFVTIPLLGRVAAGVPITAIENVEEMLTISTSMASDLRCFALRVTGDSMIDAGIMDDDIVIVRPTSAAEDGDIIVALIDGEATVKRIYREMGRVRLQPANRLMAPIWVDAGEWSIVGRVETVVRRLL